MRARKGNNRYTDQEENIKLSLFTDNMIIYGENLKELTKSLSSYSKISGYKVNIQMLVAFLDINNEQHEFENKNNAIHIFTPSNEIFGYKSNRICIRYVYRKL